MKLSEFIHTKLNIIIIIYASYLEGYSIEEISWRLENMDMDFTFEYINEIIDFSNQLNY